MLHIFASHTSFGRNYRQPLQVLRPLEKAGKKPAFSNGARERTRTSTPFGLSTSRINVYQFQHPGGTQILEFTHSKDF